MSTGKTFFTDGTRPLRILTANIWNFTEPYAKRQALLRQGIRRMDPDLLAFQEAGFDGQRDQVREILDGLGYHIVHQFDGQKDHPRDNACCIASRWPFESVETLDLKITPRCRTYPYAAMIARVAAPEPVGSMLFVCAKPFWELRGELEREVQAVKLAKAIARRARPEDFPTAIAGDFDAAPDRASIRFLTGRQSLGGMSVHYVDAWEQGGDASVSTSGGGGGGFTWTTENPGARGQIEGRLNQTRHERRIDYVFLGSFHDYHRFARVRTCRVALNKPVRGVWPSDHYGVYAEIDVVRGS